MWADLSGFFHWCRISGFFGVIVSLGKEGFGAEVHSFLHPLPLFIRAL